jgi:membrane-associated protease RseP (regulator of RpoE activity)
MLALGIALFALCIVASVVLHEAGHMLTAKAFGMKVTRFFVGFGPTLWSFRRGETEYGVKALPVGGFVKIIGMTPQDDDVEPADQPRAMWRFPVWQRTIVMAAGSVTHFLLGIVILWAVFAFIALPDPDKLQSQPVTIATVAPCVAKTIQIDQATKQLKDCSPAVDGSSAAVQIGLRPGDTITAVNGDQVVGWDALSSRIRADGGKPVTLTYLRDGQTLTADVTLPVAQRIKQSVLNDPTRTVETLTPADLEDVGVLGITPVRPTSVAGPVAAFGKAGGQTVALFDGTFTAISKFPGKVPKLWAALNGAPRDPETPVSALGASVIGGELFQQGEFPTFLLILASLNFFVGIFNLVPLLPLDGGHIAIAWFERVRSWLYARLGRRDPGRVDYMKLMPITYFVILIFGGFTVLTVAADIVNPIAIFK